MCVHVNGCVFLYKRLGVCALSGLANYEQSRCCLMVMVNVRDSVKGTVWSCLVNTRNEKKTMEKERRKEGKIQYKTNPYPSGKRAVSFLPQRFLKTKQNSEPIKTHCLQWDIYRALNTPALDFTKRNIWALQWTAFFVTLHFTWHLKETHTLTCVLIYVWSQQTCL